MPGAVDNVIRHADSALWKPIKEAGSLSDRVVARIRDLLAEEHLEPGDRLPPEREMARLLGVSRPVLREAVKTLEAQGQLLVRHGQGVFVAESAESLTRQRLENLEVSLDELFAMREVLEVPAAAWAAENATPDDIAVLARAFEEEEAARQPPIDFERLAALDSAFHLRIVEMAKNRFLAQTLGILQDMIARGMETTLAVPGRVQASAKDHRLLFEAISGGDPEAAKAAVLRHVNGAREAALQRIRRELAGDDGRTTTKRKRR